MSTPTSDPSAGGRRRIGEVMTAEGLITPEQLDQALRVQRDVLPGQRRKRLGTIVSELGMATERQVAEALAKALNLQLMDLSHALVMPEHVRLLPRSVSERYGLVVLGLDGDHVRVAASDPTNVVAIDDVRLFTGARDVNVVVATTSQVLEHLSRAWALARDSEHTDSLFVGLENDDDRDLEDLTQQAVEAAPIVRLVDAVLSDAVRAGASDVHVEPQAGELRIRYRVDGLLRDVTTVPASARAATVSRIKIVSGLDIAERRRPQDGRAKLTVDGAVVEARISTLPTLHGEKVVIRLLPRAENVPLLSRTGLTAAQRDIVDAALTQPQGLILITGPTGSGKTNTLYAAIQQLSTPDRNIVTLEDPIEVQIGGITQVPVHERSGLTFARGLRSILRQDPDIVLVGEVRDAETAELALRASMTGHLVLTTLHTNDAISAVSRLIDIGVDPFLIASSLSMVVAQRLVRKPCRDCAAPYRPSTRTMTLLGLTDDDLASSTPLRGAGCGVCSGTGYRGRTGIFEVLSITSAMRHVLLAAPTVGSIGAAAREHGMTTLRASALAAAHRGETTYEEVLRVTPTEDTSSPRCPACARALADDMVCCPWDGTLVTVMRCGGCQRTLNREWHTCPWCRTPVPEPPPTAAEVCTTALPSVLVVDDDESVCRFIAAAMEGSATVVIAHNATDAMNLLGSSHFDALLVDNGLPDLTGLEMIRLLRADPRTLSLPILLFTGAAEGDTATLARNAGADDFLLKPIEPMLLEERVLVLLQRVTRTLPTASA